MRKPVVQPLHFTVQQFFKEHGVSEQTRLLAGVSGGMDSMVLLNILFEIGYNVSVGHVNFNLRGEESDADAAFVKNWCEQRNIPFFILNKITKTVEAELRINTQTAARKIRYDWWDRLAIKHKFEFVCTAHHLDDSIETMLINLFRGSGIKGLRGIPKKRTHYIRPLLECSKKSIEAYAQTFEVPYRTDSSNLTDAYHRNRIRHQLMPILQELYPGLHTSMNKTIARVNAEWSALDSGYRDWVLKHAQTTNEGTRIEHQEGTPAFTLRLLEMHGFPWHLASDFVLSKAQDTGQFLEYNDQRLSRTEFGFFLEDLREPVFIQMNQPGIFDGGTFELSVSVVEDRGAIAFDDPKTVYINSTMIKWPMTLRQVQAGDAFQPFGMVGKHKKIQDLMVDLKMELFEKKRLLLLENSEHIIWVVGTRLDERARINEGDYSIYKLQFIEK